MNLNKMTIQDVDTDGQPHIPMANPNTSSEDGKIRVYFRDMRESLLAHINEADAVFGCIAWLTDYHILDAMSKKRAVSIVVQKEDFLKPDSGKCSNWKMELHRKYKALRCRFHRGSLRGMEGISYIQNASDHLDPVRCLGNYNTDKNPAFPRCHHKFLITCKVSGEDWEPTITPTGVWTGSFNFSNNGCNSLENAVYITDQKIVEAYYTEWVNCLQRSEPLDWESTWAAPEWRIGS